MGVCPRARAFACGQFIPGSELCRLGAARFKDWCEREPIKREIAFFGNFLKKTPVLCAMTVPSRSMWVGMGNAHAIPAAQEKQPWGSGKLPNLVTAQMPLGAQDSAQCRLCRALPGPKTKPLAHLWHTLTPLSIADQIVRDGRGEEIGKSSSTEPP